MVGQLVGRYHSVERYDGQSRKPCRCDDLMLDAFGGNERNMKLIYRQAFETAVAFCPGSDASQSSFGIDLYHNYFGIYAFVEGLYQGHQKLGVAAVGFARYQYGP